VCHFCTSGGPPVGQSVVIPGPEKEEEKSRDEQEGHLEEV